MYIIYKIGRFFFSFEDPLGVTLDISLASEYTTANNWPPWVWQLDMKATFE